MAVPVIMPKLEMAQETATLLEWLKQEGDHIEKGEPLMAVETDKVTVEIESPGSGILAGVRADPQQEVPVTEVIAYIVEPGEEVPEEPAVTQPAARATPAVSATPVARRLAAAEGVDLSTLVGTGPRGQITKADLEAVLAAPMRPAVEEVPEKVRATPAARRVAREAGVDLRTVSGTGPRGRIQEADVRRAAAVTALPLRAGTVIPLEGMRAAIARRMQQSYQTAPHIHLSLSADVTAAEATRQRWSEHSGEKISLTVLIVKACAWALRRHPIVNSTLDEEGIHLWEEVNVGVAVALPDGLIVPVLHQADLKPAEVLARQLQDLSERARQGRLRADELEGATFTITNLGMFGIEAFDPILNPPQSAILAVGAAVPTPVAWEGEVVIRPRMQLTLAADHRVLDGAVAARFLQDVRAAIEDPTLILL